MRRKDVPGDGLILGILAFRHGDQDARLDGLPPELITIGLVLKCCGSASRRWSRRARATGIADDSGRYGFAYLEDGPYHWRVEVTRREHE